MKPLLAFLAVLMILVGGAAAVWYVIHPEPMYTSNFGRCTHEYERYCTP
jgi:hypothetical protein